jgi:hypothetical protein
MTYERFEQMQLPEIKFGRQRDKKFGWSEKEKNKAEYLNLKKQEELAQKRFEQMQLREIKFGRQRDKEQQNQMTLNNLCNIQ